MEIERWYKRLEKRDQLSDPSVQCNKDILWLTTECIMKNMIRKNPDWFINKWHELICMNLLQIQGKSSELPVRSSQSEAGVGGA